MPLSEKEVQQLAEKVNMSRPGLSDAELHRLKGEAEAGEFYSLSPGLSRYGRNLQQDSQRIISEDRKIKNRAPISLGRGILYDPVSGESTSIEAYQKSLNDEAAAKLEAKLDAEARANAEWDRRLKARAESKSDSDPSLLENMPSSEQAAYRKSKLVAESLPGIIDQVKANPGAFGAFEDLTRYAPDWTPNILAESERNIQQWLRTPEEKAARSAVYEQASLVIKELAGAAVSESEKARIEGFLPAPNDSAETVIEKLNQALETANARVSSFDQYAPPKVVTETPPRQPPPPAEVQEAPPRMVSEIPEGVTISGSRYPVGGGKYAQELSDGSLLITEEPQKQRSGRAMFFGQ